ncbi:MULTISPECIES: hypothetical protein [unclassified Pseudomonas]|uniref:hypothetical protein n=1 Tax=unclassified Pseudomonas TaxID=196821 RepID=UPI00244929EB|nr:MULTISPECIES: hypothetical protein [unclassified Pseudomonas]MDH0894859.1 hypothetical protein [Pseudomonas sp. GD03875]MDH1063943.1 hypothetical protein [Pseudomonas sp. GD03985]
MKRYPSQPDDRLAKLLKDPAQSRRHDIWLWLFLFHYRHHMLTPQSCNGYEMREVLADCLEQDEAVRNSLPLEKSVFLLPDRSLEWIKNDDRQYLWLLPRIKNMTELELPKGLIHLSHSDRLIAMIDLWNANGRRSERRNSSYRPSKKTDTDNRISKKKDAVDLLHSEWRRHSEKDIEFEWFNDKKDGNKRCICAWRWLEKNYAYKLGKLTPSLFQSYQDLLIFFDGESLNSMEIRLIVKAIKNRWSRQQFDERSTDKKQVNILLSKTVITQLDALKRKHNLKRAQIVEKLLSMEAKQGLYLSDD